MVSCSTVGTVCSFAKPPFPCSSSPIISPSPKPKPTSRNIEGHPEQLPFTDSLDLTDNNPLCELSQLSTSCSRPSVDWDCVDEAEAVAGADALVESEKLGSELVVPEEAAVLVVPKLGNERVGAADEAALVVSVEAAVENKELTPEGGNAGDKTVEAVVVVVEEEEKTAEDEAVNAAGDEALVVVVTVENNEEDAVPKPNEVGFTAGVLAVVAVAAEDITFPSPKEDCDCEPEEARVPNEKFDEPAEMELAMGTKEKVPGDEELPVPFKAEGKENPGAEAKGNGEEVEIELDEDDPNKLEKEGTVEVVVEADEEAPNNGEEKVGVGVEADTELEDEDPNKLEENGEAAAVVVVVEDELEEDPNKFEENGEEAAAAAVVVGPELEEDLNRFVVVFVVVEPEPKDDPKGGVLVETEVEVVDPNKFVAEDDPNELGVPNGDEAAEAEEPKPKEIEGVEAAELGKPKPKEGAEAEAEAEEEKGLGLGLGLGIEEAKTEEGVEEDENENGKEEEEVGFEKGKDEEEEREEVEKRVVEDDEEDEDGSVEKEKPDIVLLSLSLSLSLDLLPDFSLKVAVFFCLGSVCSEGFEIWGFWGRRQNSNPMR
ncbi:hypothetical protein TEA_024499 [Camellia sinensis var. sinensis]|uniref:Uncharacterized protein n=1 Tax=Camellia sinensis var. sinensis TaxID=542762 RepID=A0A4S4D180_CAMSN|nr:hypothetical protein TEA_024499 [Camellia sinensis var. sinensis]